MLNLAQRLVTQDGRLTGEGAAMLRRAFAGGFESVTAADIADMTSAVNGTAKRAGAAVFDVTNARLMIATGAGATAPWAVADGSATVTPA
jgi:hypothetical protein